MEENKDYNPSQYEDDDRMEAPKSAKSIRGYQTIIVILAVILAALSILYFNIHRQQQEEYDLLLVDRDSIKSNLSHLMEDFDNLQISNDSISQSLGLERSRADSLMERLTKAFVELRQDQEVREGDRNHADDHARLSASDRFAQYAQQEPDQGERLPTAKEISSANLRAEVAEEKASELSTKVRQGCGDPRTGHPARAAQRARQGGVAREERLAPARRIHAGGQRPGRAGRTDGLRAHHLARRVRAVNASAATFEFEGERLTYTASRDVDYQNEDLAVGVYYNDGAGFTAGTYRVEVYADGRLAGQSDIVLR